MEMQQFQSFDNNNQINNNASNNAANKYDFKSKSGFISFYDNNSS